MWKTRPIRSWPHDHVSATLGTCRLLLGSVVPSLAAAGDSTSLVRLAEASRPLLRPSCAAAASVLALPGPAASPEALPSDPLACPARRDPEEDPGASVLALAVRLCCLRCSEWLCGRCHAPAAPGELLVAACASGSARAVAWVARRFGLGPALSPCAPEALRSACACGSADAVQALATALALPPVDDDLAAAYYEALEAACERGRREAAVCVVYTLGLDDAHFVARLGRAARRAAAKGHLGLALLLCDEARVPLVLAGADVVEAACGGHEDVVRWALREALPACAAVADELLCACAVHCGSLLVGLFEQRLPPSERSAYAAALRCCQAGNGEAFEHFVTRYRSPRLVAMLCEGSALECACTARSWGIVRWLLSVPIHAAPAARAVVACCLLGELERAQEIKEALGLASESIADLPHTFVECCQRGHLSVCQWLSNMVQGPSDPTELLITVCAAGRLSVVQWLVERYGLGAETVSKAERGGRRPDERSTNALQGACVEGHLDVVQWLCERFAVEQESLFAERPGLFVSVASRGHLAVARWLYARYPLRCRGVLPDALVGACTAGSCEMVRWILSLVAVPRASVQLAFRMSCAEGHLEVCKILHGAYAMTADDMCAEDCWAFRHAYMGGHHAVARWLAQVCPISVLHARRALNWAISSNDARLVLWLRGHFAV
eukprot:m51a1_g7897 hypothetical protein (671) ;mRNA; f:119166-121178